MSLSWLAHGLAASGPSDDARVLLTELDTGPQQRHVSPYHVAIVHTGLGDHDAAFTALELMCEAKAVDLASDPRFRPLRADRRYSRLLGWIGPTSIGPTARFTKAPPGGPRRSAAVPTS